MSVTLLLTKDYDNKSDPTLGENKPNSNPIAERLKMNVNSLTTKDYENIAVSGAPINKANSHPTFEKPKDERKLGIDKGLRELSFSGGFRPDCTGRGRVLKCSGHCGTNKKHKSSQKG